MKVSVITPVFNREKYLANAIESVLSQTYDNIELILVDDGSSDGSRKIIESYVDKYPKLIKAIFQENAGPSKARNNGISQATGDLVAFLDSDDSFVNNKIELQVEQFEQHDDIGFVYGGYDIVDSQYRTIRTVMPDPDFVGDIYEKLWVVPNEISGGTLMVELGKLRQVGGFDEDLRGVENLDLRLKLSKLGSVHFVSETLYYYRMHDDNLTLQTELMTGNLLDVINNHFGQNGASDRVLWKKVMSRYYFQLGCRHFSDMNMRKARSSFIQSIVKEPFRFSVWLLFLRSLLGVGANKALSRIKSISST